MPVEISPRELDVSVWYATQLVYNILKQKHIADLTKFDSIKKKFNKGYRPAYVDAKTILENTLVTINTADIDFIEIIFDCNIAINKIEKGPQFPINEVINYISYLTSAVARDMLNLRGIKDDACMFSLARGFDFYGEATCSEHENYIQTHKIHQDEITTNDDMKTRLAVYSMRSHSHKTFTPAIHCSGKNLKRLLDEIALPYVDEYSSPFYIIQGMKKRFGSIVVYT